MAIAGNSGAVPRPTLPSGETHQDLGLLIAAVLVGAVAFLLVIAAVSQLSKTTTPTTHEPWAIGNPVTIVNASAGVRVMEQPTFASRTLGALKTGEPMTIRSRPVEADGQTWVLVSWQHGNLMGWMRQQYLQPPQE